MAKDKRNKAKEIAAKQKKEKRTIITKRMELSEEDSIKFWTVYDKHMPIREEIRIDFIELKKENAKKATIERGIAMLQQRTDIKQRDLDFEISFNKDMTEIITAQKMVMLYRMEDAYRKKMAQQRKRKKSQERIANKRVIQNKNANARTNGIPTE